MTTIDIEEFFFVDEINYVKFCLRSQASVREKRVVRSIVIHLAIFFYHLYTIRTSYKF